MLSKVFSLGASGIEGYIVTVECFLAQGLPAFEVVGLPDATVRESRERVRAAAKICGFEFPLRRITVNLAPAEVRKEGSMYDLPILLGLLAAGRQIDPLPEDCAFLAELSLEGELRPVSGALPMAMMAARSGLRALFVAPENAPEAAMAEGISVYPARHVRDVLCHLTGERALPSQKAVFPETHHEDLLDFSEVKGQENIKRAMEIAAAGGHNMLMVGPPGAGKSMLARRLPTILPDMSREESLRSTEIYSVAGLLNKEAPIVHGRPFRAPHHTVSASALAGGGRKVRPGEISLAHNGVLFLDELPEYNRDALEALRQPMEDGTVTISRVSGTLSYPASFMLVCAMNPCRCGWYGHPSGRCTCSDSSVEGYMGRVSGPLLDRIDIQVEVPSVSFQELTDRPRAESSADIRRRVNRTRDIQRRRFGASATCNARMSPDEMERYCALDGPGQEMMHRAFDRLGLTARSYGRILRVSRTIADLEQSEAITPQHLAEALQYRIVRK